MLEATELIKTGEVYQLGRVYERDMPTFPHRTFRLTIPAFRGVRGENKQFGRDEFFVGEIGQMGTQMDGLGHVGVGLPEGNTFYNGLTSEDIEDPYGLTKAGRGKRRRLLHAGRADRCAWLSEGRDADRFSSFRRAPFAVE